MRAIVIYSTYEGQTERIARCIARAMRKQNVPTDTYNVTEHPSDAPSLGAYDAFVIGSPLHYGRHDDRIASYISEHQQLLSVAPTAFFSVSLGIISQHEKDRSEAKSIADQFLVDQAFEPSMRACFAGALRYSRYGWIKKRLMHWIAKKSGRQTKTDRDYDYTDWRAVRDFGRRFAMYVRSCRQHVSEQPRFHVLYHPQREYVDQNKSTTAPGWIE